MRDSTFHPSHFLFDFDGHELRSVVLDGRSVLLAMDIYDALGIGASGSNLDSIPESEKGIINGSLVPQRRDKTPSKRGKRYSYLTKEGAYRFLMRASGPKAERFRDWLIYEVFPRLENTGGYLLGEEKAETPVDVEALLHDYIDKKQGAINEQLEAAYAEVDRLVALKSSIEALKAL